MPGLKNNNNQTTTTKLGGDMAEAEQYVDTFRLYGFDKIPRPEDEEPRMPRSMSGLSNVALSDYIVKYTAWREYAEDLHMEVVAKYTLAQQEYDTLYAQTKIKAGGKMNERKESADADPEVVKKYAELVRVQMHLDMLSSKVLTFTNCYTTLSREITLRTNIR